MARHNLPKHSLLTIRPAVLATFRALVAGVSASPVLHALKNSDGHHHNDEDEVGQPLWILYVASLVLVLLGGAFAGLTIAFMGQDGIYLQVLAKDPSESQQKSAKRVLNLLDKGKHWVLVTLLLGNVIVNETLPVVLDRCLGGGVAAVIGSTVLIVIFGEILPQSVCVRYGLPIGGFMSKPVLLLMWLMAPVAWPTAKLLDWALGEDHGTVYKKSGLKTLVTLHRTLGDATERLNQDEVTIISAVLELKDKPVRAVMTPMDDVFTMSEDTVLDENTMDMILSAGYSRIPIYESKKPSNFIGMLLVKILITYDPEDCLRVKDFALATLPETRPETSCLDIINFFQEGKAHMVLVSEIPGEDHGAIGVVTLEDVIEELIGEEIIDESDVYIDVHKAIRRLAPAPKARHQRSLSQSKTTAIEGEAEVVQQNRQGSLSTQSHANELSSSPSTAAALRDVRRSSTGADGRENGSSAAKAKYDDLRQHFKHLGPSNRAANPKQTRSTTVKIKPGIVVTDPRPNSIAGDVTTASADHFDDGDESRPLLRPSLTGTDGIRALRQSYGSFAMPSPSAVQDDSQAEAQQKEANQSQADEDSPLITIDETHAIPESEVMEQAATAKSPDPSEPWLSNKVSEGNDAASPDPSSSPARVKHTARSGSITENVVESRGIRKVVLETTSSSDGDDNAVEDGATDSSNNAANKSSKGLAQVPEEEDEADENGTGTVDGSDGDQPAGSTGNNGASESTGLKKKNRRKKRKPAAKP